MSVRIDDLVVTVKQLFGYEQAAKRIANIRLVQYIWKQKYWKQCGLPVQDKID